MTAILMILKNSQTKAYRWGPQGKMGTLGVKSDDKNVDSHISL